jgi:D-alanyl-lipoteichoic acid acyltransferase DltB (MBOAT superfamily)
MCVGFGLPDNFRYPYAAKGFSDFWSRWHISLSTWLRDYLYIPLGGNRYGQTRTLINLMLTMLIGGLWHGAAWTFVIWGGIHGAYLIAERFLRTTTLATWKFWRTTLGELCLIAVTYFMICLTWVFFRADTFPQSIQFIQAMFFLGEFRTVPSQYGEFLIGKWEMFVTGVTMSSILLIHFLLRRRTLEDAVSKMPGLFWIIANVGMIVSIIMMPGEDRAFIYFQF